MVRQSIRAGVTLVMIAAVSQTVVPLAGQGPVSPAGTWTGPRTVDGQPDVQGSWRPVISGGRSLEDPGVPGSVEEQANRTKGISKKNPSRVSDPEDGKVPYQPWAAALRQHQIENENHATREDHIDTQARCFILGAVRQAANVNLILQPAGYVVLINESYHNFRVIPIDGRPPLSSRIALWGGDSRGRWEGNTLVVEITNLNGKNRLSHDGDFLSNTARIVERFTFQDGNRLNYEATIDDPKVFTRTWKITIPTNRVKSSPDDEPWESACHEGERSADLMLQDK
jgi:hypothetical protein